MKRLLDSKLAITALLLALPGCYSTASTTTASGEESDSGPQQAPGPHAVDASTADGESQTDAASMTRDAQPIAVDTASVPDVNHPADGGLVSADVEEPLRLVTRVPILGATDVPVGNSIVATFNRDILYSQVRWPISIFSYPEGDFVNASRGNVTSYNASAFALTLPLELPLQPNTTYEITVSGGITDRNGSPLIQVGPADRTIHWIFGTAANTPDPAPRIIFVSPTPPTEDVSLTSGISIQFSEDIRIPSSVQWPIQIVTFPRNEPVFQARSSQIQYNALTHTLTLPLGRPFLPETAYEVRVDGGITDATGNSLVPENTLNRYRYWRFATGR